MLRVLRKTFYQTVTLGKKSSTSMVLHARQGGASLCAPCVFLGDVPTWNKLECAACLRCLHSCPKGAIQRGPKTRAHGQYLHP